MSAEVLERAFEPFFTTKDIGRGTGLGLSQVVGFIDQSGGSVEISSEVERGTIVTLILPRASADKTEPQTLESISHGERLTCRLLLVEDNAQARELAQSILAEEGHVVIEAAQADAAIQILKTDPGIEFVLSDLVMPGEMDGLDLARTIREKWPATPVVLASGYSDAAAKVLAEGFHLIPKPYHPELLIQSIRKALCERRGAGRGNVVSIGLK